jgi:hypothetical protein
MTARLPGDAFERSSLVARAMQGDHDAFGRLAADAIDRMHAVAWLILRDQHDADDAVQDALVRPGVSCRGCATATGSTPGCGASWSTPATMSAADKGAMPLCAWSSFGWIRRESTDGARLRTESGWGAHSNACRSIGAPSSPSCTTQD